MALLQSLVDLSKVAARNAGQFVTATGLIKPSPPTIASNHVISLIENGDSVPERSRVGGGIHSGYTHLSSLLDVCPRQQVLAKNYAVPLTESHSGSMKLVFAYGRAAETHARKQVMSARGRQGIYGKWVCPCDLTKHVGDYPAARRCPRCQKGLTKYNEPLLLDIDREIAGAPDLTLIEGSNHFLVTEFKSMEAERFDKLKSPLGDHCAQGLGYRRLFEQSGFPMLPMVSVVYIRKEFIWGGGRNRLYKEFQVTEDMGYKTQLNLMWAAAEEIARHKAQGTVPARVLCGNAGCSRAKQCPVAHVCFTLPEDAS